MVHDDQTQATSLVIPIVRPAAAAVPLMRGLTVAGSMVAIASAAVALSLFALLELEWSSTLAAVAGLGALGGVVVSFANVVARESALRNLARHAIDLVMTGLLFGAVILAANLGLAYAGGEAAVGLVGVYTGAAWCAGLVSQPLVQLFIGAR